jgi:hypothetical protein
MTFIIVVASRQGIVKFECSAPAGARQAVEDLGESASVAAGVERWARAARVGAWLDWPGGYAFAVSGPAARVADEPHASKARA